VDLSRRDFLKGAAVAAGALAPPVAAEVCVPPKLIELGWHTPEALALKANIAAYEAQAPCFDGIVVDLLSDAAINNNLQGTQYHMSYLGFSAGNLLSAAAYSKSIAALKATPFQRYSHNLMRIVTQPGLMDWFDARQATLTLPNAKLQAQLARDCGCKGIFLDTEAYSGQCWNYAKQREVALHTFEQYQAQARLIGQQYGLALQAGFPGADILLSWGYYLPYSQVSATKTLAQTAYGLLPSFLDGLLDVTNSPIYDGYEHAYGFKSASDFDKALAELTVGYGSQSSGYGAYYKPSFGLWLDCYGAWNNTTLAGNWFTPAQWQASLELALAKTSKYVWIYDEGRATSTPTGTPNWYDGTMPVQYMTATNRARGV
jgi:TAT (twin-arginine translocation) pathway signal sequence